MIDFLKLIAALLAIYFGFLGIRGDNNVDVHGKLTTAGKRTAGVFLSFSMLGVFALLGESVEKLREAEIAHQRYLEATARDSVNLQRSELLVNRSEGLVRNLHRLDSLTEIQVAERARGLEQQRALLVGQSTLLRSSARGFYPHDSVSNDLQARLIIDGTFPPTKRLMDSIWTLAMGEVPRIIRDSVYRRSREFDARLSPTCHFPADPHVAGYCDPGPSITVRYTLSSDTTLRLTNRIRPKEFFVGLGDWSRFEHPLTPGILLRPSTIEFYCCGIPKTSEAPMLEIGIAPIDFERDQIHGNWGDHTIESGTVRLGLWADVGPRSIVDFVDATVILRLGVAEVPLSHLRFSFYMPLDRNRNLVLGEGRWTPVLNQHDCVCFVAKINAEDIEFFPGELTGGPGRRILAPFKPLRRPSP